MGVITCELQQDVCKGSLADIICRVDKKEWVVTVLSLLVFCLLFDKYLFIIIHYIMYEIWRVHTDVYILYICIYTYRYTDGILSDHFQVIDHKCILYSDYCSFFLFLTNIALCSHSHMFCTAVLLYY